MGQTDSRSRKSSIVDPPAQPVDRPNAAPTTFFLARTSNHPRSCSDSSDSPSRPNPVSTVQEFIEEPARRSKQITAAREGQERSISRRRSTIKPVSNERLRRGSAAGDTLQPHAPLDRPTTPSPFTSQNASSPSSPKSLSSRSVHKSDDELMSDDATSQAIASSEDDEEPVASVQDSQPELIMPRIKMPSRRPFTTKGRSMGRFKILVAGQKGSGKTSLIKSIVQVCEDIVHVDPLTAASTSSFNNTAAAAKAGAHAAVEPPVIEIYASTKPYPTWWSDLEESRILRRRKSMGDSVLERNLCFVDTSSIKLETIISYVEQQLVLAMNSAAQVNHDFVGLLSGRGGSQVDAIFYLVTKDNIKDDQDRIRRLSEICSVVPLIARSDLLSEEEQGLLKHDLDTSCCSLPRLPAFAADPERSMVAATAPYTITSINGPDLDTMDASLLMSPEYIQPLLPSELSLLIEQIFEPENIAYLKHTSAKKLLAWHATHPRLTQVPSPSLPSVQNSTLASPLPTSLSNSGVLIPQGSELSLNTSNSFALARVADHAQREERLAQIRLSKWASDLQLSLQRERERYERLARGERAVWLVDRMGEELKDGQIVPFDQGNAALVRQEMSETKSFGKSAVYQMHDPLGLLQWRDTIRARGWITLQIVGSFGVVGGLAFWLAKTMGFTSSWADWAQSWSSNWFGMKEVF